MIAPLYVSDFLKLVKNADIDINMFHTDIEDARLIKAHTSDNKSIILNSDNASSYYGHKLKVDMGVTYRSLRNIMATAKRQLYDTEDISRFSTYSVYPVNLHGKENYRSAQTSTFEMLYDMMIKGELVLPEPLDTRVREIASVSNTRSTAWDETTWNSMTLCLAKHYPFIDVYRRMGDAPHSIKILNCSLYRDDAFRKNIRGLGTQKIRRRESKSSTTSLHQTFTNWGNSASEENFFIRFKSGIDNQHIDERLLKLYKLEHVSSDVITEPKLFRGDITGTIENRIPYSDNNYVVGLLEFLCDVCPDITINDIQYLRYSIMYKGNPSFKKVYRNLHCQKLKERVLYLHDKVSGHTKNRSPVYPQSWCEYF